MKTALAVLAIASIPFGFMHFSNLNRIETRDCHVVAGIPTHLRETIYQNKIYKQFTSSPAQSVDDLLHEQELLMDKDYKSKLRTLYVENKTIKHFNDTVHLNGDDCDLLTEKELKYIFSKTPLSKIKITTHGYRKNALVDAHDGMKIGDILPNGVKFENMEGVILSGKRFNEVFVGQEFRKRVGNNCGNFQYQTGVNIDTNEFRPYGACNPGGLYFTTDMLIWNYQAHGDMEYRVTIPSDAFVYMEGGKAKANKIILDGPRRIREGRKSDNY